MKRPAESCKAVFAAGLFALLLMGFAGRTSADTKPKFVYVANSVTGSNLPGTVSGYSVDSTTGALTPVPGSSFAAGVVPLAVAVSPSNKFVYVANSRSNNISAYTVDSATGALTAVAGSPFVAGNGPRSVAIDPSGKFAYVACDSSHNNLWAYAIDATTGALNPAPGSPYDTAPNPVVPGWNAWSVTTDPNGKFLYVSTEEASFLTYKIDSNTGALTVASSSLYGPGPEPSSVAQTPSGKFVYVTGKHAIYAYTVDRATGALTEVIGSPFESGFSTILSLAIDPLGKFLYAANAFDNYISAYAVDGTTGTLTAIVGSPFTSVGDPFSMAIDPAGKFAYVAVVSNTGVAAYTIDGTDGALAPIPGSPSPAEMEPTALAVTHASPTVPFAPFKAKAEIDEDRRTSFRVEGFFTLGADSNGINPVSETVNLQVGTFSVTIPAGSFEEKGKHAFRYDGQIIDVDLRITIEQGDWDDHDHKDRSDHDRQEVPDHAKDYLFTAEGRGHILAGVANPVTVGLTIGDDTGSTTVKADIDK